MSNPETLLQRQLLEYLLLRGVFAWRNNAGWIRIGKRVIEMAPPGSPDLIGVLPDGRLLGIEVKMPGERLRPVQEKFQERLRGQHAVVFTVHSLEELRRCVDPYLLRLTKPAVAGSTNFQGGES